MTQYLPDNLLALFAAGFRSHIQINELCVSDQYFGRSAVLCEAVKAFRPDLMLVDKHPFGAGGELALALKAAKVARGEHSIPRIFERGGGPGPHRVHHAVVDFGHRGLVDATSCDWLQSPQSIARDSGASSPK